MAASTVRVGDLRLGGPVPQEPIDVVRDHLDAVNAGDAVAATTCFHLDGVFSTGSDAVVHGRPALRTFFTSALAALPISLEIVDEPMLDRGRVGCELLQRTLGDPSGHVDPIAAFYRVEDGLIRSAKVYREGRSAAPWGTHRPPPSEA
jgi:hypothetical protein